MSITDKLRAVPQPPEQSRPRHLLLTQIQALRAIAVLLVVLYHLWPKRLTGGYVGVDVFFVISGFLMTKHLLRRSADGTRIPTALNDFYVRRIRRILPASVVLLAVVTVVTLTLVSRVRWEKFLGEIVSSTLYVENWALAAKSTDYLAADTGASPVQHFWSLSVEEQFYLVWPLALLVVGLLAARRRRAAQLTLIGLVIAGGLAYSVWALQHYPAAAYFDTAARLWEFGLGGLLAFGYDRLRCRALPAAAFAWLGLALIAWSALTYTGDTAFPGPAALVPCLGAVLVIASGDRSMVAGPHGIFRWRPVQFIGDISYSVYLWHWPMIALWPGVTGHKLDTASRGAVFVASIVVGWLSKIVIEDRFRRPGGSRWARLGSPHRRSYTGLLLAMVVLVAVAGSQLWSVSREQDRAEQHLAEVLRNPPRCYGVEVVPGVKAGCSDETLSLRQLTPSPLIATAGFEDGACQQRATRSTLKTCHFGTRSSNALRVVLTGDSHATQWLPALAQLARTQRWNLTTYLMSGCAMSTQGIGEQCQAWNRRLADELQRGHNDVVIVAARSATGDTSAAGAAQGLAAAWRRVAATGSRVIALRDVPQPVDGGVGDVPSCVYDSSSPSDCTLTRGPALARDEVHLATKLAPDVPLVDLTDLFCTGQRCRTVIGNVLVYLDDNHMTPVFSLTAAQPLLTRLRAAGLEDSR